MTISWGRQYSSGEYITDCGKLVHMRRKWQRVRFYTQEGEQVGPEQRNVAPAIAYALSRRWREVWPEPESAQT